MKQKTLLFQTNALIALGMSAGLLMGQPAMAKTRAVTRNEAAGKTPGEEEPVKKTKSNSSTSRNNSAIKIYPDILKRSMHVVAKDEEKQMDFFVFDLNGTIIQQFKLKEKDHIRINGLARGKYIYRVFAGDEEAANGNFEIR